MVHSHQHVHRHQHSAREESPVAGEVPSRTEVLKRSRVLVARETCTNESDPGCAKPTATPTAAIVVAVVYVHLSSLPKEATANEP